MYAVPNGDINALQFYDGDIRQYVIDLLDFEQKEPEILKPTKYKKLTLLQRLFFELKQYFIIRRIWNYVSDDIEYCTIFQRLYLLEHHIFSENTTMDKECKSFKYRQKIIEFIRQKRNISIQYELCEDIVRYINQRDGSAFIGIVSHGVVKYNARNSMKINGKQEKNIIKYFKRNNWNHDTFNRNNRSVIINTVFQKEGGLSVKQSTNLYKYIKEITQQQNIDLNVDDFDDFYHEIIKYKKIKKCNTLQLKYILETHILRQIDANSDAIIYHKAIVEYIESNKLNGETFIHQDEDTFSENIAKFILDSDPSLRDKLQHNAANNIQNNSNNYANKAFIKILKRSIEEHQDKFWSKKKKPLYFLDKKQIVEHFRSVNYSSNDFTASNKADFTKQILYNKLKIKLVSAKKLYGIMEKQISEGEPMIHNDAPNSTLNFNDLYQAIQKWESNKIKDHQSHTFIDYKLGNTKQNAFDLLIGNIDLVLNVEEACFQIKLNKKQQYLLSEYPPMFKLILITKRKKEKVIKSSTSSFRIDIASITVKPTHLDYRVSFGYDEYELLSRLQTIFISETDIDACKSVYDMSGSATPIEATSPVFNAAHLFKMATPMTKGMFRKKKTTVRFSLAKDTPMTKKTHRKKKRKHATSPKNIYIKRNSIELQNPIQTLPGIDDPTIITQRLFSILQWYQSDNLSRQQLVQRMNTKCKSILDDYIEIICNHNTMIHYNPPFQCNISECQKAKRHLENKKEEHNINDIKFLFYRDLLDSMHFYLMHLYDSRYRVYNNQSQHRAQRFILRLDLRGSYSSTKYKHTDNHNSDKKEKNNDDEKKEESNDQYENDKQDDNDDDDNKRHYDGDNDDGDDSDDHDCHKRTNGKKTKGKELNPENLTFMDGVYEELQSTQHDAASIIAWFIRDEYETDVIISEVNNGCNNSNIVSTISNQDCFNVIAEYTILMKTPRFFIGYRFYYWEYFNDTDIVETDHYWNKNNHLGYSTEQLYIKQKYDNLQQEILHNTILPLTRPAFQCALIKSDQYHLSKKVKTMKAASIELLKYDIKKDTLITKEHLLAVILYCDFSDLSREFTETHRTIKYTALCWIKKRNREYAIWSRLLREAVEIYGSLGYDEKPWDSQTSSHLIVNSKINTWNINNNRIRGPFYCGMTQQLLLEEYNIRLCAPVSTSAQLQIAKNFAGEQGIVLQLNNNGYADAHLLRVFDCSWISGYTAEDEKLFMGGFRRIKIESIWSPDIDSNRNLYRYTKALFCFHCMLSGTVMNEFCKPEVDDTDYIILDNLIKHKLKCDGFQNGYDEYINRSFTAFLLHQTQIVINLPQILKYFGELKELLLHCTKIDDIEHYSLKNRMYTLCSNVRYIIFHSSVECPIDLYYLSRAPLFANDDVTVIVKVTLKSKEETSWISTIMDSASNVEIINSNLKQTDYSIQLMPQINSFNCDGDMEDRLIISQHH